MPQAERRDWPLTVAESVRFGRVPHRGWLLPFQAEDQRVVEQALSNMSLSACVTARSPSFPAANRRRTIIARALAQDANVLLLDEPTAGLDLRFQAEVLPWSVAWRSSGSWSSS